jgi:hypothetical protein
MLIQCHKVTDETRPINLACTSGPVLYSETVVRDTSPEEGKVLTDYYTEHLMYYIINCAVIHEHLIGCIA